MHMRMTIYMYMLCMCVHVAQDGACELCPSCGGAHLAIDVTEESHCLVKDLLELLLRRALVAAPKLGVNKTCHQLS